jgi:hypothetical protein
LSTLAEALLSRSRMMVVRRAIPIATVAAIALALMSTGLLAQSSGAPPTHAVLAKSHRTIYFFSNPGISVEDHNPLVIRPSGWPLFQDGQWVLEKLHWTGWGSSVAHGKGLSSSSNGIPNAAEGKRIITSARVTLSKPVRFHGHEVYSCFRLKVPPPAHYPFSCLQRLKGGYVGFTSPGSGTPIGAGESAPGTRHLTDFLSPDHKVWCLVGAGYTFCVAGADPAAPGPQHSATVERNGQVRLCSAAESSLTEGCTQNWDVHSPVLHYGERSEAEGIRCTSAPNGITCIKVSGPGKGKGFRVNKDEAVRVG